MRDDDLCQKIHDAYITANQAELQLLWDNEVPATLIKFFPATYSSDGGNYFLEHLENKTIWLSSPILFNDPFDCKYNYDYWVLAEETKKNLLAKYSDNKEFIEFLNLNFFKENFEQIVENFKNKMAVEDAKFESTKFVTCFSEEENLYSKRMWAYYANSHKGVCAEYDFGSLNKISEFGCIPIKYTDFYNRNINISTANERAEEFLKLVYTKAQEWEYEKEWRIAKESQDDVVGFNVDCALPKKIYIGCKASNKLKNDILNFCTNKETRVFQMKIKPGTFNLEFEECK